MQSSFKINPPGGETFDAPTEWMNWHSSDKQDKREQADAPYLKPTSGKKPEKFGNIRI